MNEKIVMIDDELDLLKTTADILKEEGYAVQTEPTGKGGLQRIREVTPDLVLLDLRLPDIDGFQICKELKSDPKTRLIPIVLMSSKSEEIDVVLGFELGAEDYVIKPYRRRELLARIKAALRRKSTPEAEQVLERGPIRVDLASYKATVSNQPLLLTPKELQLLGFFLKKEGQVVRRSTISEEVWGMDISSSSRTIDVHVEQLRKKLVGSGAEITGLKGIGYKFEINPS